MSHVIWPPSWLSVQLLDFSPSPPSAFSLIHSPWSEPSVEWIQESCSALNDLKVPQGSNLQTWRASSVWALSSSCRWYARTLSSSPHAVYFPSAARVAKCSSTLRNSVSETNQKWNCTLRCYLNRHFQFMSSEQSRPREVGAGSLTSSVWQLTEWLHCPQMDANSQIKVHKKPDQRIKHLIKASSMDIPQ